MRVFLFVLILLLGAFSSTALKVPMKDVLKNISNWILTTKVETNNITNHKDTLSTSIFINGNLARTLLASYKIFKDEDEKLASSYLSAGLGWCDTLCKLQHSASTHDNRPVAGWWDTGYSTLYIADTGTAVTALAVCAELATSAASRATYLDSMSRFAEFIVNGTNTTPQCSFSPNCTYDGGRNETAETWLVASGNPSDVNYGALGDGYYQGTINLLPYTISTATSGGAFFAEMWATTGRQEFKDLSRASVDWLTRQIQDNGTIPYFINPPTLVEHTYQCISYSAEAFIDADIRNIANPSLPRLKLTVEYLLQQQQPNGELIGPGASFGEQQRSPRAISLLQWYFRKTGDQRAKAAIDLYLRFLTSDDSRNYGLNQYALVTGFVGLAVADLIKPWCTFVQAY